MKVQKQNEANWKKKEEAAHLAFGMFSDDDQQQEESAHLAKERDAQLQAQEKANEDNDLAQQRTMLLVHKVARETMTQMEIEHEQALLVQERKAARLHEIDRITQVHLE